jgi:HSP20 family protein
MAKGQRGVVIARAKPGRLPHAAQPLLDPTDRMLDDLFAHRRASGWERPFAVPPGLGPSMDVIERSGEVIVRAALPGVKKENIEVSLSGVLLTIRGDAKERTKEEQGEYYRCEIPHGGFSRTLALPAEVDESKAKAAMKDGVLELRLPKPETAKRNKIRID